MTTDSDTIRCATHGESTAAYVCEHLVGTAVQRWHCDYPSEETPWPDAWCDHCNTEFLKRGEWDEANEGLIHIKVLCSSCYESLKAESINCADAGSRRKWQDFAAECCQELSSKNEQLWQRFSLATYRRWDWNQDAAELTFSNDGVPGVVARITFVGTVSTKSDTWLWSWANFSLVDKVREPAVPVRDFGEQHDFLSLTIPKWPAKESDGWHMAAIAARILGAEGAYRTPGDNGFSFMVLHDVRRI